MVTLRARFDGKVLIPEGPVDLPTGRTLEIQVVDDDAVRSNPDVVNRILQIIDEPPHLTKEDVDALERAIEEGKLPVNPRGAFDEP